jgi:hypothetical protein
MTRLSDFFQYHNAVPIALGILMLGAGATFAATDPSAIYSAQQRTVTEDNTYIAGKDLDSYTPRVEITSVTEDADAYYVAYDFSTIDSADSVWRDVVKHQSLTVAKSALGEYGDLGLYVTDQLKQNIDHELDRLHEAQAAARARTTQKTVATVYGGLIGKMLDDTTEALPGYTPVVVAPEPKPSPDQLAAAAANVSMQSPGAPPASPAPAQATLTREEIEAMIHQQIQQILASQQPSEPSASDPASEGTEPSAKAPVITVNGENPAHIHVGDTYSDLSAVITAPEEEKNLGIKTYLNGTLVSDIVLDTTSAATDTIDYVVTGHSGLTSTSTRQVIVEPLAPPSIPDSAVDATTTAAP